MSDQRLEEFRQFIDREQRKKIAILLHEDVRAFVNQVYADDELLLDEKLGYFFRDVLSLTQSNHLFLGNEAHLTLVKNWNHAKSSKLSLETLFYLLNHQSAKSLVARIIDQVFSIEERQKLLFLASPRSYESELKPFQIMNSAGLVPEPEMIWVPDGSFMRGTREEFDRDSFEGPRLEVTVHNAFGMGKYPITVEQYRYFAQSTAREPKKGYVWNDQLTWEARELSWDAPGFSQGEDHPVVGICYDDALAYSEWLTQNSDKKFRLPSETEWEYCCRAGTETAYYWGDTMVPENAQYQRTRAYRQEDVALDYERRTAPVQSFQPNPWGFYQMHGNVWEICADPWIDDYFQAPLHAGVRQVGD